MNKLLVMILKQRKKEREIEREPKKKREEQEEDVCRQKLTGLAFYFAVVALEKGENHDKADFDGH